MNKKKIPASAKHIPTPAQPDLSNIASAAECTGLMPVPPQNEEELRSYQQLSVMAIPKADGSDENLQNSSKNKIKQKNTAEKS